MLRKDRPKRRASTAVKYKAWPSLALYDRLGVPYVVGDFRNYGGALWTGHTMILNVRDIYGDPAFLHELVHWLAASPRQRELPDFGLDRQVNHSASEQWTSSSTPWLYRPDTSDLKYRGWGEECVTPRTASSQEALACHAMALYRPLACGRPWVPPKTGVRSAAKRDQVPEGFYDFGGGEGLESSTARKRVAERLVKVVCEPLGVDVGPEAVANYLTWAVEDGA